MVKRLILNVGDKGEATTVKAETGEVLFKAKPGEGVKVGMLDVARTRRTCCRVPNPHAPYECSEPEKCCNPGPRTKEG